MRLRGYSRGNITPLIKRDAEWSARYPTTYLGGVIVPEYAPYERFHAEKCRKFDVVSFFSVGWRLMQFLYVHSTALEFLMKMFIFVQ